MVEKIMAEMEKGKEAREVRDFLDSLSFDFVRT